MDAEIALAIDRDACAGHGLCYSAAPDLVDSDDEGYPVVIETAFSQRVLLRINEIVTMCPERALRVVAAPTPQER